MHPHLIIGLGNSEPRYAHTYHNVGFLAVHYFRDLARAHTFSVPEDRLLLTDRSMNTSGAFVRAALARFKISPAELLLVHDDSDIALGHYKFSFSRGSAGHKGVEDVTRAIGTNAFWRLRIGIRKEGDHTKALDLVLQPIPEDVKKILTDVFHTIGERFKEETSRPKTRA